MTHLNRCEAASCVAQSSSGGIAQVRSHRKCVDASIVCTHVASYLTGESWEYLAESEETFKLESLASHSKPKQLMKKSCIHRPKPSPSTA